MLTSVAKKRKMAFCTSTAWLWFVTVKVSEIWHNRGFVQTHCIALGT